MKITAYEEYYDEAKQTTFQKTESQTCCADMSNALDNEYIGYGERTEPVINESTKVNIYSFVTDEDTWLAVPINYCPFCSASIEIEFINH